MLASLAATLAGDASAAGAEDFAAGNSLYGAGDYTGAREAYARCLKLAPARTDCKTNLASVLLDLDPQHEALAETLYRQVLQAQPDHGDAAFNLALILQGRKHEDATAEAAKHYQTAVAADPDRWDAWANLANALAEDGRRGLAIRAYQRAILLIEQMQQADGGGGGAAADDADATAALALDAYLAKLYYGFGVALASTTESECAALAADAAVLLVGQDDHARLGAAVCAENAQNALRTTVDLDPSHPSAEHMLAALMAGAGGAPDASLTRGSPGYVKALFDDFSDSFDSKLARRARAQFSRRASLGARNSRRAQFSARAILGAQSSADAPPPARRSLGYRVPELVGAAAAAVVRDARGGRPFSAALDAGCGTGLAGPYLRPLVAGALIGVDISTKMLELAANLRADGAAAAPPAGLERAAVGAAGGAAPVALYDRLLAKDLLALRRDDVGGLDAEGAHAIGTGPLELVVAADVLVYFGALDELLRTFAGLSAAGASLIFSCERVAAGADAPASGWRLMPSGRFAHTKAYVVAAAAASGYALRAYDEIVPRREGGVDVQGHVFVFELAIG